MLHFTSFSFLLPNISDNLFCNWLPLVTPRMPRRPPQLRDVHGRFIAQPQQEESETNTTQLQPQPALSQLNTIQRLLLALNRPLITDTPISELVVNLVQAAYYGAPNRNSPDPPPSLPFASDSIPSPPACYIPPPHYVTDLLLPAPDFNVPGSDNTLPPLPPLPPSSEPEDVSMPQQHAYYSDDELSYIDNEEFAPLPPLLLPCLLQVSPSHPR